MSVVSLDTLKSYFETGDFPTQSNFVDLIDTLSVATSPSLEWTDISNTSTVTGWLGSTRAIKYIELGELLILRYSIDGISNSTSASFTIPFTANGTQNFSISLLEDNTVFQDAPGYGRILNGQSTLSLFPTPNNFTWTAGGTKKVVGFIVLEIN